MGERCGDGESLKHEMGESLKHEIYSPKFNLFNLFNLANRVGGGVREIEIQIHNIIVYNLVEAFVDMASRRMGLV